MMKNPSRASKTEGKMKSAGKPNVLATHDPVLSDVKYPLVTRTLNTPLNVPLSCCPYHLY